MASYLLAMASTLPLVVREADSCDATIESQCIGPFSNAVAGSWERLRESHDRNGRSLVAGRRAHIHRPSCESALQSMLVDGTSKKAQENGNRRPPANHGEHAKTTTVSSMIVYVYVSAFNFLDVSHTQHWARLDGSF